MDLFIQMIFVLFFIGEHTQYTKIKSGMLEVRLLHLHQGYERAPDTGQFEYIYNIYEGLPCVYTCISPILGCTKYIMYIIDWIFGVHV